MTNSHHAVTGVILAGGKSRRMGQNKALMRLGRDTIIGHVIRQMQAVTTDLLLITNTPKLYANLGLPMHVDVVANTGALGGIYTGLTYAKHQVALCVGCDMPLIQPNLLGYLISCLEDYDAVVPCVEVPNRPDLIFQTLCAVYTKRCLPVIDQMFTENELRVHALYDRISARTVQPNEWKRFDAQGLSFFNINTPSDFKHLKQIRRIEH